MSEEEKTEKENVNNEMILYVISIAIIFVLIYVLFGFTGIKTIFFMALFFMVSIYFILMNFDFNVPERIVFSFFLGIALFPLCVWYINMIIPSMRTSSIIAAILLISTGIILKRLKK